jgi:hypothetical protein
MKIEFKQPIGFLLEVLETDDHIPSMRVNVQIAVVQFQNTCRYEGNFWIECANWDAFLQSLHAPAKDAASLQDISGCFTLEIRKIDGDLSFAWTFKKVDVGGGRQIEIAFASEIDDDVFAKIKNEFLEFPAWW